MKLSVIQENLELAAEPAGGCFIQAEPLVVLKFGSSVIRRIDDLPAVAGEIYRQRRKGQRVIAVVSALAGETDRLFEEAARASGGASCSGIAELVLLGEERTAALLKIACDRIGLRNTICRAEELGLHTVGKELDADFAELRPFALARKLESCGVVIVPGFVGTNESGERTLLGRGGSDFTAAILGGELGAKAIRLYKDVDGVFDRDPAIEPTAHKFEEVAYEDVLRVASPLVQAKAIAFAASKGLPIEVEAIGSNSPTRIGERCRFAADSSASPRLRVALAGYGVVGQALARRLTGDPHFEISAILVRDLSRLREVPPPVPLTNNAADFAASEADVLVELLSCTRTGALLSCKTLQQGRPVVTASKRLVSERFADLLASSKAGAAQLLYSAAVGGSAPLIETSERAKELGTVERICGILNGTVNFVLQRVHEGGSLEDALQLARQAGFAEENADADLSGADAAAKLRIAAHHAFGVAPGDVDVLTVPLDEVQARGIQTSGERWVQLSQLHRRNGRINACVALCPLAGAPIGAVDDEWNVGVVRLVNGRELCVRGRGAGGAATAEAVLADLYDLLDRLGNEARQSRLSPPRRLRGSRNVQVYG